LWEGARKFSEVADEWIGAQAPGLGQGLNGGGDLGPGELDDGTGKQGLGPPLDREQGG
jgi:hypothetical protein